MSLKEKTITGLLWNAVDKFASMGLEFVIGIILARLLTPKEFGLIGLVAVFIAISQMFINSGFSQALIRKNDCTQTDYATVFIFNLLAGIFFFLALFLSAPLISNFFNEPQLTGLIQVLGVGLLISSITIIQRTTLIKRIDFKLQTRISVLATVFSGGLAILMAIKGFGVWSLVAKSISRESVNSVLLWFWNKWKPTYEFSKASFDELFGFGSKLLLSGLIGILYYNIFHLIIGKIYSVRALGFYTRAEMFKNLVSQNVETIITGVGYPVLAKVQDDKAKLAEGFKTILNNSAFIIFILMAGLAATAEPVIHILVGKQWETSIVYLQLLCFVGMIAPLTSININMLNVVGRSDIYLKLQIFFLLSTLPILIVCLYFGLKVMIMCMIIHSLFMYIITSKVAEKYTYYLLIHQLRQLLPLLFFAISMGLFVYVIGQILNLSYLIQAVIQIVMGAAFTFTLSEWLAIKEYQFLKNTILQKLKTKKESDNV